MAVAWALGWSRTPVSHVEVWLCQDVHIDEYKKTANPYQNIQVSTTSTPRLKFTLGKHIYLSSFAEAPIKLALLSAREIVATQLTTDWLPAPLRTPQHHLYIGPGTRRWFTFLILTDGF